MSAISKQAFAQKPNVIEDAEAGIRAAKAGGMFAVAVHSAAGCPLADESLKTFEELLNIG